MLLRSLPVLSTFSNVQESTLDRGRSDAFLAPQRFETIAQTIDNFPMAGMVVEITDETYAQASGAAGLVLVTFGATWCGPCRVLQPVLQALAADYDNKMVVATIDIDSNPRIAEQIGVTSLPTIVLYNDGKLVAHWVGAASRETLEKELDKHVPRPAERTAAPIDKLEDAKARLAQLMISRDALESSIRQSSVAAVTGAISRLAEQVEAANSAVVSLSGLVLLLEGAVNDDARPTAQRLGALAALLYLIAPQDALDDTLPGGYGYLDDFLVMNAAVCLYVRKPDASRIQDAADMCTLVWLSLPIAVVGPLMQFITRMELEAAQLASLPEEQLVPLFDQLRAQPAPVQFVLPPVEQQAISQGQAGGLGGWSTNANGAIWGSGDGRASYMRFEGGGSIGMVGDKIVGGG